MKRDASSFKNEENKNLNFYHITANILFKKSEFANISPNYTPIKLQGINLFKLSALFKILIPVSSLYYQVQAGYYKLE